VSTRISAKAIALGFAAGFAAGAIYSLVVGLVRLAMSSKDLLDPAFVAVNLVGALGTSVVAGYVAARFAPGAEVENSVAVGAVVVLLSAIAYVPFGMDRYPAWYNIPAFLLTIPFCIVGGIIRRNGAPRDAA